MKVLHISASDIDCKNSKTVYLLHRELIKYGIDSRMLVLNKSTSDDTVFQFRENILNKIRNKKSPEIPDFTFHTSGKDISGNKYLLESDIIHICYTGNLFINAGVLKRISKLNRKIIFSYSDSSLFTGGCRYPGNCTKFMSECSDCGKVSSEKDKALVKKEFYAKKKIFNNIDFTPSAKSSLLRNMAQESALLGMFINISIPLPLDTGLFKQTVRMQSKKRYILSLSDSDDVMKCISIFEKKYPETAALCELIIAGTDNSLKKEDISMKINYTGEIKTDNELAGVFTMANVVLSSITDNSGYDFIAEAMASKIPVASLENKWLSDLLINNENSYIADKVEDLPEGIIKCLNEKEFFGRNAHERILKHLGVTHIAESHINLYRSIT